MAIDKSKFLVAFKAETKDHLEKLTKGVLDLEKDPHNVALLDNLMKEAHTVKGSASMMGFRLIADIAHKLEDGFEAAPDLDLQISNNVYDLIFECLDTIESLLEGTPLRKAKALDEAYVTSLCQQLLEAFGEQVEPDGEADEPVEIAVPILDSGDFQRPGQSSGGVQSAMTDTDVKPGAIQSSESPGTSPSDAGTGTTTESIRVDVGKLGRLMNLSGELLISKIRLNELIKRLVEKSEQSEQLSEDFGDLIRQLVSADENFSMVVTEVQDEALSLRMVSVANLFGTFSRSARDLAKQHGKQVDLVIKGEETFLDKNIIDRMKGPMTHLLRNCIDHGIEVPAVRTQEGKAKRGQIVLNAYRAGSQVVLEVSDDGQGIDCEKVKNEAVEKGLVSPGTAQQLGREQVFELLFHSGFSTCATVTATSGRGVGLDVVRSEIAHLKGTIEVKSELGNGTSFLMKLPLTLSIIDALLIGCGDDVFTIPLDAIVETTRVDLDEIESVEGHSVMRLRGQIVPLMSIHDLFSLPRKGIIEKRCCPVVIVQSAEKKLGLLVDEILGHQAIVVKPLGDPMGQLPNIAGGTVLGSGRVVLILDVASMVKRAGSDSDTRTLPRQNELRSHDHSGKRILLAEDIPCTAQLESSVLEEAGFSVTHAQDGEEAIHLAMQQQFDLVITDVLMPRMNGFELTTHLRESRQYRNTPIVIVTTRSSPADRKKGMQAGANAYVLKQDFTSDSFLEIIDKLLIV